MRSLMICTAHQILFGLSIREEKCIHGFDGGNLGKETTEKTQA
jgi:hypothetical protein